MLSGEPDDLPDEIMSAPLGSFLLPHKPIFCAQGSVDRVASLSVTQDNYLHDWTMLRDEISEFQFGKGFGHYADGTRGRRGPAVVVGGVLRES